MVVLTVVLVIVCVFGAKKNKTSDDAYRISTPEQLNIVRNNLSGNYVLVNDINLDDWGLWEPIGQRETPFTGTFNGNGFVIYNMNVNKTVHASESLTDYQAALFGCVDGGKISNLGVYDSNVHLSFNGGTHVSYGNVGGLVGVVKSGIIENCFFEGSVSATCTGNAFARSGGLVGNSNNSLICDSYVNASVYANAESQNTMAAGIVPWLYGGTIKNCHVKGTVNGLNKYYCYVGGINASGEENGMVESCVVAMSSLSCTGGTEVFDNVGNYSVKSNNKVVFPESIDATSITTYSDLGWDFENTWSMYNEEYAVLNNYINFMNRKKV